tara:strand:+ start:1168 stop:2697 length:1530 start_codon:yes stop_codon:yes gene_type:complete
MPSCLLIPIVALTACFGLHADKPDAWNQFRGPNGSGVHAQAGFSVPSKEGLRWKTAVPSGLSCPVLSVSKIFLTGIEQGRLVTLALDRKSGKILWKRKAPQVEIEKFHESAGPATPTPFVDEDMLFVYFGSFGMLSYDHRGKELWSKPLPTPKSLYGTSCSPIVDGTLLILVTDDDNNLPNSRVSRSRILAIDKKTGKTLWERPRPFHRSGWSTPTIWEHDGGRELVVLGNGSLRGYSLPEGEEKWQVDGFSRETIARPMAGKKFVFASASKLGGSADLKTDPAPFWEAVISFDANGDGRLQRKEMTGHFTFPFRPQLPPGHPGYGLPLPKDPAKRKKRLDGMFSWMDKNRDGFWDKDEFIANLTIGRGKPLLVAVKPGGSGNVTDSHLGWEFNKGIPEVPSPILHEDRVYMISNGGVLTCVDASKGEMIYRRRLEGRGQYVSSPVVAGNDLILASEEGLVSIIRTGDEFKAIGRYDLGETIEVTPALGKDTLFLRSKNFLWAFGKPGS